MFLLLGDNGGRVEVQYTGPQPLLAFQFDKDADFEEAVAATVSAGHYQLPFDPSSLSCTFKNL